LIDNGSERHFLDNRPLPPNRASVCGVDQLGHDARQPPEAWWLSPGRPNLATGRGASVGASTDREPVRDASRMRGGSVRAHGAVTRPSLKAGPYQART